MSNYMEVVQGGKFNRGTISELPEGFHLWEMDYYGQDDIVDCYTSVYYHSKDFLDHVESTGKVKGYRKPVWTDTLVWDFDNPESLEDVLVETNRFIAYLIEECYFKATNIRMFYSGQKGFHVLYASPELEIFKNVDMQPIVKKLCTTIAEGFDFFDGGIYDTTRIFRSTNSKHPSSGRYKIEIPLLTCDTEGILEDSKTQQEMAEFVPNWEQDITIINGFKEIIELVVEVKNTNKITSNDMEDIIENGFTKGRANNQIMSIAGLLHSRNINENIIRALLGIVNDRSKEPVPDSELYSRISSVSEYHVASEYVETETADIVTFREAGEEWKKLMELSGDFSFGPRFPHINDVMNVTLLGDMVGIVAASGVGKSTLLFDMLNQYSIHKDCEALGLSLEMSKEALFFRAATISYKADEMGNVDSKELAYQLIHDDELMESISVEWDRVKIVDRGLNIEQIDQYIQLFKLRFPNGRIVGVDFLQNIDNMNDVSKAIRIVKELKKIAKRNQVIIIPALQTNKANLDPYMEVGDVGIEGAAALKQCMDYLMAFWKSRDNIHRLQGKFLKTRWVAGGGNFSLVRDGLKYHSEDYVADVNPQLL